MAIESPLFQSAMELLGHSFSHFNGNAELDRKLVILHLANATELILKDLVLDAGESIYKGPKETITIHGCFKVLEDKQIEVPLKNRLELLIDERNALQHRFGSPNELTTIFYMNISQDFFRAILDKHYDQNYDEVISQFADEKELAAYRLREPTDDTELENLKKLANVHSLGALLSAMTYFEKLTFQFVEDAGLTQETRMRPPWHVVSPRFIERFGVELPPELSRKLHETRKLRNLAAHGREDPSKESVIEAIQTIEEYEKFLKTVEMDKVRDNVREYVARVTEDLEVRKSIMHRKSDD